VSVQKDQQRVGVVRLVTARQKGAQRPGVRRGDFGGVEPLGERGAEAGDTSVRHGETTSSLGGTTTTRGRGERESMKSAGIRESSGQVYDCDKRTSTRPLTDLLEIQGVCGEYGRTATVGRPVKDGVNCSAWKRRAARGLFTASARRPPPSLSEK